MRHEGDLNSAGFKSALLGHDPFCDRQTGLKMHAQHGELRVIHCTRVFLIPHTYASIHFNQSVPTNDPGQKILHGLAYIRGAALVIVDKD